MNSSNKILAVAASAACLAFAAQANLITNGSFEDLTGIGVDTQGTAGASLDPGQWGVYTTIPGWTTVSGPGIELHRTPPSVVGGVLAADGNVYVELDSHPGPASNSAMQQTLNLAAGEYQLTFKYRPRTDSIADNIIEASFNGNTLVTLAGATPAAWTTSTTTFTFLGGTAPLKFTAMGTQNTLGGFIDDVKLVRVPDNGSMMAMLGAGLMGLGFFRRRVA